MQKNTYNISFQQIQIFLKAAETLNFSQVAQYFNFTPSTISKHITALEEELGLTLFTRKPHVLTLTPAAEFLVKEWRPLIASINNTIAKATAYQSAANSMITVGIVDSSSRNDEVIANAVKSYIANHPNITIIIEKHDMHRASELLNYGMLDIAVSSAVENKYLDEHSLPWEKIRDTDIVAYVPIGNKLFTRDSINFEDIKTSSLASLDFIMHPGYANWLYEICSDNGFTPNISATFRTIRSLLYNFPLNNLIFIGESITSDWIGENLKGFTLPGNSYTTIAWRSDSSEHIISLKNHFKSCLQQAIE